MGSSMPGTPRRPYSMSLSARNHIDSLSEVKQFISKHERPVSAALKRFKVQPSPARPTSPQKRIKNKMLRRECMRLDSSLKEMRQIDANEIKRKRPMWQSKEVVIPGRRGSVQVTEVLNEMRRGSQSAWLHRRKVDNLEISDKERRMLRYWFDSLDKDGSGHLSVSNNILRVVVPPAHSKA